jgi:hypothetical protein
MASDAINQALANAQNSNGGQLANSVQIDFTATAASP